MPVFTDAFQIFTLLCFMRPMEILPTALIAPVFTMRHSDNLEFLYTCRGKLPVQPYHV